MINIKPTAKIALFSEAPTIVVLWNTSAAIFAVIYHGIRAGTRPIGILTNKKSVALRNAPAIKLEYFSN